MQTTQEAVCAGEGKKENRLLTIFTVMFKIGCVTFGGGWGIIAQMQEEFVDRRAWIDEEQLVDFISLGRSFPGIMIINIAVLFGYTTAGFWGAVLAAFGLSLPALLCIAVVTYFYSALKNNVLVARALDGVRCAVIPIILGAALRLREKSLTGRWSYVLAALALIICTFTGVAKILVVLGGAALGLLTLAAGRGGRKK
ncbi:MAG: chromate transporter [Enterocloster asparagiformis]|nr:chromate transporter [Enterocloster asparagiformis]